MGTQIFLGKPPASIEQWIKNQRLKEPLCFTAVDPDATITFNKVGSPDAASIVYATESSGQRAALDWQPYTFNTTITLANVGDKVYFRAADENNISFFKNVSNYYRFATATTEGKRVAASGNIQTLMKADGSILDISGKSKCYQNMFQGCTSLTTAPALPSTTLSERCYVNMFENCSSLTDAPALPATTLATYCYSNMFQNCSSLTDAPALPATTLADNCYSNMFSGCSSLTSAPVLPATTLASNCYRYMFKNCSSLTDAPALPATTLADSCYSGMFQGCYSLTTAPVLPATTLVRNCYSLMFDGCSSLTTAPSLPATTLADNCYSNMFYGCTSLTSAPVLPATTLASNCYSSMFQGCTSLTTAPELPAMTLATYCYGNMFSGCSSLTSAPVLPATTLATYCYQNMFTSCTSLTTAPVLPATTFAEYCYENMFYGCNLTDPIYFSNSSLNNLIDAHNEYTIFGNQFGDFEATCTDGTYTISMSMFRSEYEFYDNYVYYHGTYSDHSESDYNEIGEITSSEDDLNNNHSITIRFNGSELIHGFDEELTFNIDVDNSDISYSTGGQGGYDYYASGLNEQDLGCFDFYSFNGDGDDIWVKIPIQEKS